MSLFDKILAARGLDDPARRAAFLNPDYEAGKHDPFLLPDMDKAVERLVAARNNQEHIMIYGDYDIDGLTATSLLLDSFESLGFENVEAFIPNRFVEGYGMTIEAVEKIAKTSATLIVTVDCGSLSEKEIIRAGELGVDVIVTDHHNVALKQPPAVAVINPKRLLQDFPDKYENFIIKSPLPSSQILEKSARRSLDAGPVSTSAPTSRQLEVGAAPRAATGLYPFLDLPGVGVAFKLVQALQTRLDGLELGQEKWLLDLVALGTVCDIVTLRDENRLHVYWGLKVLAKTRRPGLKALMAVAGVDPSTVNSRSLGFALGPRMNAAGRLETAQIALDMLTAKDNEIALERAYKLDEMNAKRRSEQDKIFKSAIIEAEKYADDPVLVVSGKNWNHGIIGIVAAKLLEKYQKPTYVLEEMGVQHELSDRASGGGVEATDLLRNETEGQAPPELMSKGSARSYGDFSAADAIRAAEDIITKGGGHKLAAGVTLPTKNIAAFRRRVNEFYRSNQLDRGTQLQNLLAKEDAAGELSEITEGLIAQISQLEPFGSANQEPIIKTGHLIVTNLRRMGSESQHVKLEVKAADGTKMQLLAFNAPDHFFVEPGEVIAVWYQPSINEWQGRRSVEGQLKRLEIIGESYDKSP